MFIDKETIFRLLGDLPAELSYDRGHILLYALWDPLDMTSATSASRETAGGVPVSTRTEPPETSGCGIGQTSSLVPGCSPA
jgi:hypothetical protein